MSNKREELRDSLKNLQRPGFSAIVATVLEVNRAELTCDVKPVGGGAEIFDVRLRAVVDAGRGGVVLVPKQGSVVVVATINNNWNSAYLALVSELDLISIKTDQESLKTVLQDMLATIQRMVFSTNQGPTIDLVNSQEFTQLSNRLNHLFLD